MVRTPTKWTFTRVLGVLSFGVDALVKVAGLTVANTSQHLQQLRQAGLVTSRKEGLKVYYNLSGSDMVELFGSLRSVTKRHIVEA